MTGQTPPAETPEIPRHSRDSAGWLMKSILLHMRMEMDKRMESVGLTDAQWTPILHLASGEGRTAAELSRNCLQSPGGMTRMLDRLEAKGLVERVRSRNDRRVVNLVLTEEGLSAARFVPDILREVNEQALENLSADEARQLKSLLQRVLGTLQDRVAARAAGTTGVSDSDALTDSIDSADQDGTP